MLEEFSVAVVVLHHDRIYEDLEAQRTRYRGTPEARLYNPEKGIPRERLETIRRTLEDLWGKARYVDGEVELYWKR